MDYPNGLVMIGVLIWNFILYFIFYAFSIPFGDSELTAILYFFVGGISSFWTGHVLLTLIPSFFAFPLAFFGFTSAVYGDVSQGQYNPSITSLPEMMTETDYWFFGVSVCAGTIAF